MGDIPQTRPFLERSEVLQPVAQHGMEVEALATSPLQEMVGPAAQTTRCALNPANPGAPSVVNAPRHPSLAGVCQHTTAGLHDWRAERPPLCGGAPCWVWRYSAGTRRLVSLTIGPDFPLSHGRALWAKAPPRAAPDFQSSLAAHKQAASPSHHGPAACQSSAARRPVLATIFGHLSRPERRGP